MDLLVGSVSPLISVLQYMSSLLFSEPAPDGRVKLLCLFYHCLSMDELMERFPAVASTLRRSILSFMGWLWRKHIWRLNQFPWLFCKLADSRSSRREKDDVLAAWSSKASCCLRPGMAARMKQAYTSKDYLQTPEWRQRLWAFAAILRTSVADIEVRHPRNAQSSGRGHASFAGVASNYVNVEHTELTRASVLNMHSHAASPAVRPSVAPGQQHRLKGRGPVKLFQEDYNVNHCVGGKFSAAYWEGVRKAYSELPDDRKRAYEAASRSSVVGAAQARVERRKADQIDAHEQRHVVFEPCCPPMLRDRDEEGDVSVSWLPMVPVQGSAIHLLSSRQDIATTPALAMDNIVEEQRGLLQQPIATALLDGDEDAAINSFLPTSHMDMFLKGRPTARVSRQFVNDSRRIAGARVDDKFPDKVEYPTWCQGLCKVHTPPKLLQLNAKIMRALCTIASRAPSPARTAQANLIFACEQKGVGRQPLSFWWLLNSTGRQAQHAETQIFMRLQCREEITSLDEVASNMFTIERAEFTRQTCEQRPPFCEQAAPPRFFSEFDVAEALTLCETDWHDDDRSCCFHMLATEDRPSCAVYVCGLDADVAPIDVPLHTPKVDAPKKKKCSKGASEHSDFMELLEDSAKPKPAKDTALAPPEPRVLLPPPLEVDEADIDLTWMAEGFSDFDTEIGELVGAGPGEIEELRQMMDDSDGEVELAGTEDGENSSVSGDDGEPDLDDLPGDVAVLPPKPPTPSTSVAVASSKPPDVWIEGLCLRETGSQSGIIARVFTPSPWKGSSSELAVVHSVRPGMLSMTCRAHNNCVLWLNLQIQGEQRDVGLRDLVCRVANADPDKGAVSEQVHWEQGRVIKRRYGMKVQGR